jgi:hypothetical protein
MMLKNHDLIQFLAFNDMTSQIILEIVFNLKVETSPFQLNNQPLDALYFPNDKTVININANENDLVFRSNSTTNTDLTYFPQNQYISAKGLTSYRTLLHFEPNRRLYSLIEDNSLDLNSCLLECSCRFLQPSLRAKMQF